MRDTSTTQKEKTMRDTAMITIRHNVQRGMLASLACLCMFALDLIVVTASSPGLMAGNVRIEAR